MQLFVVIAIAALTLIGLVLWLIFSPHFKPSDYKGSYDVRSNRGVPFFVSDSGTMMLNKIVDVDAGTYDLHLKDMDGNDAGVQQRKRDEIYIANPGKRFETWIDLQMHLVPAMAQMQRFAQANAKDAAVAVEQYNMLKANFNSELDKEKERLKEVYSAQHSASNDAHKGYASKAR